MEQRKKTIIDQVSVFVHRKWVFIIPAVIGTAAGLLVSFQLPQKYSSTTLIVAEEQQVPEQYVTPADKTPFSDRLNLISQQILSRTRLDQIIKQFKLYGSEGPGLMSRIKGLLTGSGEEQPTPEEIIEKMRNDIAFEVVGEATPQRKGQNTGGNAFTISYKGSDPETTMQVTNTLASLFIDENLRVREQYAEGTSEFLSAELDKAQQELSGLEQKLKDFKQAHMGSLPEQLDANLRTLDRMQADLQTVSASIKNNEDRKRVLEDQLKYTPGGSPVLKSSIAAELEKSRAELSQALTMFKETWPDVIILRKRIKDLEGQLKAEAAAAKGESKASPSEVLNPAYSEFMSVKSQITTLKQREANLRRQIGDYERRVEVTPGSEQQLSDLTRDYKISLENYQALLNKKMNARLAENLEKRQKGERFRVVDPANLPQEPAEPNKPLVTGAGAAAGAGVGAGLVLLLEFLNPAFRKPEDFEGVVDSPVLTSIPLFHGNEPGNAPIVQPIKGNASV